MTKPLHLDEQTIEHARQIAMSRHCTLEDLLKQIIEQLGGGAATNDSFLGMWIEEPSLLDQVLESVMKGRAEHSLRQNSG